MTVSHQDSVQKIISYLKKANAPKLTLSRLFFRDYTCPSGCGGCCPKFSLDYFEGERWEEFKKLYPDQIKRFQKRIVNGVTVYSDFQKDNPSRWCRNLNLEDGRCKIHKANPFSCEFELMKFAGNETHANLIKKLFGRGHSFLRVDGEKGALCRMIPMNPQKTLRDIELLKELHSIGQSMRIQTKLGSVIKFLEKNKSRIVEGKIPTDTIRF